MAFGAALLREASQNMLIALHPLSFLLLVSDTYYVEPFACFFEQMFSKPKGRARCGRKTVIPIVGWDERGDTLKSVDCIYAEVFFVYDRFLEVSALVCDTLPVFQCVEGSDTNYYRGNSFVYLAVIHCQRKI